MTCQNLFRDYGKIAIYFVNKDIKYSNKNQFLNPRYSGGRDQEEHSSKAAQPNSLQDPTSKTTITEKKKKRPGRVVQRVVQTPVPQKKMFLKNTNFLHEIFHNKQLFYLKHYWWQINFGFLNDNSFHFFTI
jgi:hypothetical protein